MSVKLATAVPALVDSGTVPAFTCDCPRFLSAHLRDDVNSTCVCLRLREQCLRSEKKSVTRVAYVIHSSAFSRR